MCVEKVEEASFGQTHEDQKKKTFRKWTMIEESIEHGWMWETVLEKGELTPETSSESRCHDVDAPMSLLEERTSRKENLSSPLAMIDRR